MSTTLQSINRASGYQLMGDRVNLYEEYWVPALMGPCAEDLVDAARLKTDDKILDVACGTGVVARAVASRKGFQVSVTGTDINKVMLDAAQYYAGSDGARNIQWCIGDAANLPFESSVFNVVFCQQGLQFMPNRLAAVNEMARVLVPGGRLIASVWKSGTPFGTAVRKALSAQFGEDATSTWSSSISLGYRHELRALAEDAGFADCHVRYDVKIGRHHAPEEFISGIIAATSLSDEYSNLTSDDRKKLLGSVIDDLKNNFDDGGLAYPAECHTLTAQKQGSK